MAKRGIFGVILEIIILFIFIVPMFNLNFITGIFYLIAVFYAFSSGLIAQRKNISWMIIFGTLLSYLLDKGSTNEKRKKITNKIVFEIFFSSPKCF